MNSGVLFALQSVIQYSRLTRPVIQNSRPPLFPLLLGVQCSAGGTQGVLQHDMHEVMEQPQSIF